VNDQLTPLRQLVDRSNRIGDDASLVVYGGATRRPRGLSLITSGESSR
jgi:hypothetical protein